MSKVLLERTYDLTFSFFAPFLKAEEVDGQKLIVVRASDTSIDRDNERVSPELIIKMKELARQGKLELLESHRTTFPLGYSVGVLEDENDPNAFYPIFRLDDRHPLSQYLFERIKEGSANFGVSVGGKHPKVRWVMEKDGKVVTEVVDAEIDHVAFTRRGYEANPNTGIVRAIIKQLQTVGLWEKEMNVLEQVTRIAIEGDKPTDNSEIEEGKHYVADDERIKKVAEAVLQKSPLTKRTVNDEEFAREMYHAIAEAKTRRPHLDALIFEREREFGYERGVYACPEPPAVWRNVPLTEFADQVGYFYPTDEAHFEASYRHFLKVGSHELYLPDSAVKVLANFVRKALEKGYAVSYRDNPLLMSLLPSDLKAQISDYDPTADIVLKDAAELWVNEHFRQLVDGDDELAKEQSEREKLQEALRERAEKYGYEPPLNANLSKPARWKDVPEDQFADPVGYKYPVHTPKNARAALSYFNKPENRRFYTVDGQIKVLENILRACLRHGIKVAFQPDDPLYWLIDKAIKRKLEGYDEFEDQDTEEKRAEMRAKAERTAVSKEETIVFVKDAQGLRVVSIEAVVSGTAADIINAADEAETVGVKVRKLMHDVNPDLAEPKPVRPEEIRFIVALPVETYPLSLPEVVARVSELASKVGAGAVDFNVVRIDGTQGRIFIGKEGELAVTLDKDSKAIKVLADGRALPLLIAAVGDTVKEKLELSENDAIAVEAINKDFVVFSVEKGDGERKLYAFRWTQDSDGTIKLSDAKIEVVETYLPADIAPLSLMLIDEGLSA